MTTDSSEAQDIARAWDSISAAYQARYEISLDRFHFGPMCPDESELSILGSIAGARILDIGCGGGQNSIWLAAQGAASVLGLDPSVEQIGFARRLAEQAGSSARFEVGDSSRCREMPGEVDLIVSIYSLMYVADLGAALEQMFTALAPGGRIVISVDHPWRLAGSWEGSAFVLNHYFVSDWESWDYSFPEKGVECRLTRRRRTLEEWLRLFLAAGFRLDGLREPGPPHEDDMFGIRSKHGIGSDRNVYTRERLARLPSTLIFWGSKA